MPKDRKAGKHLDRYQKVFAKISHNLGEGEDGKYYAELDEEESLVRGLKRGGGKQGSSKYTRTFER